MTRPLAPPLTPPEHLAPALRGQGYAVLGAAALLARIAPDGAAPDWSAHWADLPPDAYLRDGGRYRRRRHGCFVVDADTVQPQPHRAHWQPLDYNALHGGLERWFEPLAPALAADPAFGALLRLLARQADALRGPQPWSVEAHAFRIDTTDGIGRPTPEGAHRDGVDLVAVMLLDRHRVRGGETRIFDADGPRGLRFTLQQPWTLVLLDDARVIHETTPIQPVTEGEASWRDTLVVTLRAGGFQAPAT